MPSRQKRRVSLSEELAALDARLTRRESFPPSSITALGSNVAMTASQSLGPTASWASFTTAPFDWGFTLTRAQPLLFLGSIGLFYGAGTVTYALVRVVFTHTFGNVTPATDVNGASAVSNFVAMDPFTANAIGSGGFVLCATMPAGSYHVQAQYLYAGAVSTVFTVAGNVGTETNMIGNLFALSG